MIDVQVRVHDKFSIEFKAGFLIQPLISINKFALNMWFFVPNSLDINSSTYDKRDFYNDLKSNVRLITPSFRLDEIASGEARPLRNIESALVNLAFTPSLVEDYEYEIKMFMAIFNSSVRNQVNAITRKQQGNSVEDACNDYIVNISTIMECYRRLRRIIDTPEISEETMNYYLFGDEFMNNVCEQQTYRLIRKLRDKFGSDHDSCIEKLKQVIADGIEYQRKNNFPTISPGSPNKNRDVIYRQRVLKKYIESDLFLDSLKKRDGVAMEQFYYGIAAGVSMIFATVVAFTFQQRYGNFTMPFFIALVIGYMFKDRIKELMRFYFAHRLKEKYFDNKTKISVKKQAVGYIKEGVDFITDAKVAPEVMEIRSRSALVQAENRINDEKIILFRKMVELDSNLLEEQDKYLTRGINDIMRFNLTSFTQKMDAPEVPLYTMNERNEIGVIYGEKIYYLNIIFQMQHEEQLDYKRFRVIFNRLGIVEIERL